MHKAPDRFGMWASLANTLPFLLLSNISPSELELRSWKEAMKSQHADQWKKASQAEYDLLMQHKVWKLVELPPGKKAIGSRWTF